MFKVTREVKSQDWAPMSCVCEIKSPPPTDSSAQPMFIKGSFCLPSSGHTCKLRPQEKEFSGFGQVTGETSVRHAMTMGGRVIHKEGLKKMPMFDYP